MNRNLLAGLAAGAAGVTVLNAVTYLDMVARGRPASSTPEDTVRKVEELAHLPLSEDGPDSEPAQNRRSGLGAMLGIVAGVGAGLAYGLVAPRLSRVPSALLGMGAGVAVNVGTTGPMVALGITNPLEWPAESWVSDLVPHLAYGLATSAVFDLLRRPAR